jgi:hypothetical protein
MEDAEFFELPNDRPQKEQPFEDLLLEAFLNGALASDHAKSNDGSPPSLERFCASVANRDPLRYMQLLISKFAGPRSKATNFSPLGEVDNMSTDDD